MNRYEEIDILVLSRISVWLLQVCQYLIWYWLLVCSKLLLLCLGMGLEFLSSPILLTWKGVVWRINKTKGWFFERISKIDKPLPKPTVHPCDEAYLIIVNDGFDLFLDLVWNNFIVHFCIYIHKWDWSEVLFFSWVLVWFRYQSNCGFIEWFR